MVILILSAIIFLFYLVYERILLNRRICSIPLRISVTGVRGKSSVARLVASVLQQDGRRVVAKTTGSQAQLLLADGDEIEVPRRGTPSIIEQKKLIKRAAEVNADCIVAEVMSIHPENHYVESQQILKPNIVLLTNVRQDHIEAMGKTEDEIASVLCLDIPQKATVFIPEKENRPLFQTAVKNAGGKLIEIQEGISSPIEHLAPEIKKKEFSDDINLVYALGRHLNIDQKVIVDGIRKAKHDIGSLKIWKYKSYETQKIVYLVNGFAANDPQSTSNAISKLKEILPADYNKFIGLLSLRSDRGDRTIQWIQALKSDRFDFFSKLYVTGTHTEVVKRKVKWVNIIKYKLPEKITESIIANVEDQAVIFGMGNMVGTGKLLVSYWNSIGKEYGL